MATKAAPRLAVGRTVNVEDVPAAISRALKQPPTRRADPPNGHRADLQVEAVSGAAAAPVVGFARGEALSGRLHPWREVD
jgi:hypothetical protein